MKRSKVRTGLAAFAAGAMMLCASAPARAGIPVIDVAAIAQAVQIMWQGTLGATVELQSIEGRSYSQVAAEGAFNVWRMGWGMDYPDANNIHAEIFHSNVGSPAIIKIAEFDRLVDEGADSLGLVGHPTIAF